MTTANLPRGNPAPATGVEITIERVTSDIAHAWLGANINNRRPIRHKIEQYKRDMASDAWAMTGEAIKFGRDGELLDGQNRLMAVVEADAAIVTVVIRGLAATARNHMDTGAARTAGQVLTMLGYRRGNDLAATARIALVLQDHEPLVSSRRPHSEIVRFVEDNPELEVVVADQARGLPMLQSTAGYVAWVLNGVDADSAADFLAELRSGANLPDGSPVLTARAKLTQLATDPRLNRAVRQEWEIGTVFRAWIAWRNGETLTRIRLGKDENGRPRIPDLCEMGIGDAAVRRCA